MTVGGTIVRAGGRYSKNLKIRRGGTYRVWTGSASGNTRRTSARRSRSAASASGKLAERRVRDAAGSALR